MMIFNIKFKSSRSCVEILTDSITVLILLWSQEITNAHIPVVTRTHVTKCWWWWSDATLNTYLQKLLLAAKHAWKFLMAHFSLSSPLPAVSLAFRSLQMGPGCGSISQDDVDPSCLLLLFLGLYPLSTSKKPDTTFKHAHLPSALCISTATEIKLLTSVKDKRRQAKTALIVSIKLFAYVF